MGDDKVWANCRNRAQFGMAVRILKTGPNQEERVYRFLNSCRITSGTIGSLFSERTHLALGVRVCVVACGVRGVPALGCAPRA
jgi:hypothetical protein